MQYEIKNPKNELVLKAYKSGLISMSKVKNTLQVGTDKLETKELGKRIRGMSSELAQAVVNVLEQKDITVSDENFAFISYVIAKNLQREIAKILLDRLVNQV